MIERPTGLEVSREVAGARRTAASSASVDRAGREDALRRAREFSPFLRETAAALPELVAAFLEDGSAEAVVQALAASAETVESELRRRRAGVALTVALGDLSGELGFVEATRLLSDFADMTREMRNEAARFVTLIDALYEHRVKLLAAADAEPSGLYPQGDGSFEFQRTVSRLEEMRSAEYLAEGHGTDRA